MTKPWNRRTSMSMMRKSSVIALNAVEELEDYFSSNRVQILNRQTPRPEGQRGKYIPIRIDMEEIAYEVVEALMGAIREKYGKLPIQQWLLESGESGEDVLEDFSSND